MIHNWTECIDEFINANNLLEGLVLTATRMCPSSNDRACPSPETELLFASGEKAEMILRTSPPLAFFSGTGDSSGMF
jgi:hypothetical protein